MYVGQYQPTNYEEIKEHIRKNKYGIHKNMKDVDALKNHVINLQTRIISMTREQEKKENVVEMVKSRFGQVISFMAVSWLIAQVMGKKKK